MIRSRFSFHFLRLLPISIIAEWRLFLPVVVILVIFFVGMHSYLERFGRFNDIESLGYGLCFTGFIALWIVSCSVTRLGNPKASLFLHVIPMEAWKRTTLVVVEHILMVIIWVSIPFGIVAAYVQPEGFAWDWFVLLPIIGSSAFCLAAAVWLLGASNWVNAWGEIALNEFALGVGWIFLGTMVLPLIDAESIDLPFLFIAFFLLVISMILLFLASTFSIPQKQNRSDVFENDEKDQSLLSKEMMDPVSPGMIQYKIFLKMTLSFMMNSFFLGTALYCSHSLMDFWIHGYDNYIYYQLGQDEILFNMIDYAVWLAFILLMMISLGYFGAKMMTRVVSIGYVILDCRTRPLSGWIIVLWAVLNVIVFALGIRIIDSGLASEIDLRLPALMSLCLFFTSGTVFWFASIPSIALGKGPENTIDFIGLKESFVLVGSGIIMLFTLVTNSTSFEALPIDFFQFNLLFAYNIWAMHWMWNRY